MNPDIVQTFSCKKSYMTTTLLRSILIKSPYSIHNLRLKQLDWANTI